MTYYSENYQVLNLRKPFLEFGFLKIRLIRILKTIYLEKYFPVFASESSGESLAQERVNTQGVDARLSAVALSAGQNTVMVDSL